MNIQSLFTRFQVIKKLAHQTGHARTRSPDPGCAQTNLTADVPTGTERLSVVTSCAEDSKSNVTIVTWLDDVRDLEAMENRLNEALEIKLMTLHER
jgi:hypothetical protein